MSVGFGFSAGDFIAALELVHTVINALRESGDSSAEYRELISQLFTLETALIAVKNVDLDDVQHSEVVALQQAASQCQRTIDAFWEKIKKYQPHLRSGGSGSRVKDGWMRVKWVLCRKDDVVKFKADLMGHTESIEMLLTTVQMAATRIDSGKNDTHHKTLAGKVQDSYFGCMQRMSVILKQVSTGIQQGKEILEMTAKIFRQNVQNFQIVLNMQSIIMRVPGQVERQQPVYFIDAIGRHMAFHLEFVLSAEALISVLRSNFKNIGPGARKIDKGEFAIQDSITKKDINLKLPWDTCFTPGQHADMSMVFSSVTSSDNCCPKCRDDNGNNITQDKDIECRRCKMVYRRSVSIVLKDTEGSGTTARAAKPTGFLPQPNLLKRQAPHDEDEEIALFRRVRIHRRRINRRREPHTSSSQPPLARVQEVDVDPYADPDLLRMLEDERKLEAEITDAANSMATMPRSDRDEEMVDDPDPQAMHEHEAEFEYSTEYERTVEIEEALRQEYESGYGGQFEFDKNLEIEEALRRQELNREAEAKILAEAQAELEIEAGATALAEAEAELEREYEAEEALIRRDYENSYPDTEGESDFNEDEYDYEEMLFEDSRSDRLDYGED